MCIRDSNYSFMNMETYEQVELNKKQIENEVKYLKEGLEAVSYTHLDVYKRQVFKFKLFLT